MCDRSSLSSDRRVRMQFNRRQSRRSWTRSQGCFHRERADYGVVFNFGTVLPRRTNFTSFKEISCYETRAGERKELLEGLLSDVDGARRPVSIVLDEEQIISRIIASLPR